MEAAQRKAKCKTNVKKTQKQKERHRIGNNMEDIMGRLYLVIPLLRQIVHLAVIGRRTRMLREFLTLRF